MKVNFPYTKELKKLADTLLDKGDELKLVGGCVRNFLMKKPLSDFDLACKYEPQKTMEILKNANIRVIPTGIEHGTVTTIINKIPFEITTLRKDIAPDGRHSEVEFTDSYLEDAKRRDFTINAIYLDFEGNIYDYFDGLKDIKTGIIRFIGNSEDRIKEDYLRILRFFRFFCYYGFVLDKDGLEACAKNKNGIKKLSGERIKMEIFKILQSTYPVKTLQIMQDNEILQQITNSIEFDFKKLDLFYAIKKELKFEGTAIFNLAILLKERNKIKEDAKYFKNNWKFSNKEYAELLFLLENKISEYKEAEIKNLLFKFKDEKIVINLFILDYILNKEIKKRSIEHLKKATFFIENYKIPELPITGKDLIKIGFKEGKQLGESLKKAKRIFIESDYKLDKEQILLNLGK